MAEFCHIFKCKNSTTCSFRAFCNLQRFGATSNSIHKCRLGPVILTTGIFLIKRLMSHRWIRPVIPNMSTKHLRPRRPCKCTGKHYMTEVAAVMAWSFQSHCAMTCYYNVAMAISSLSPLSERTEFDVLHIDTQYGHTYEKCLSACEK